MKKIIHTSNLKLLENLLMSDKFNDTHQYNRRYFILYNIFFVVKFILLLMVLNMVLNIAVRDIDRTTLYLHFLMFLLFVLFSFDVFDILNPTRALYSNKSKLNIIDIKSIVDKYIEDKCGFSSDKYDVAYRASFSDVWMINVKNIFTYGINIVNVFLKIVPLLYFYFYLSRINGFIYAFFVVIYIIIFIIMFIILSRVRRYDRRKYWYKNKNEVYYRTIYNPSFTTYFYRSFKVKYAADNRQFGINHMSEQIITNAIKNELIKENEELSKFYLSYRMETDLRQHSNELEYYRAVLLGRHGIH